MITFVYRLTGSGSSEASIADDSNAVMLTGISYLSDALRDLVAAVIKLLEGGTRAEFSWPTEPGEYQWLLTCRRQLLSIRITRFAEWEQDRRTIDPGKSVLKLRCQLPDFASAVLAQLTELHSTLGPKGYKERWVANGFPLSEYERLTVLLGAK